MCWGCASVSLARVRSTSCSNAAGSGLARAERGCCALLQPRLVVLPLLPLLDWARVLPRPGLAAVAHAVDAVLTLLQLHMGALQQLLALGVLPAVQDLHLLLGLVPCLTA